MAIQTNCKKDDGGVVVQPLIGRGGWPALCLTADHFLTTDNVGLFYLWLRSLQGKVVFL